MFSKIFRPKWQHRKAEVRIAALSELDANDPVLLQMAGNDEDPAVRRHAMRRICDLPALAGLLDGERDAAVRESCSKRLKRLLAGEEDGSPAPTVRRQLLIELGDEEVLGYVLQHAAEIELRQAALEVVCRPSLLAEVALSDPSGELRLAALERIERDTTLERIARQARGKDKRVARRARERLEAMRTEAGRPERQAAICEAVVQLVEQGGVDLIAYGRLHKEWQGLLPTISSELAQRFDTACRAFDEAQSRRKAEAAMVARQRELCERIEELQREVEGNEATLIGMDSAITLLARAWQTLEEESASLNPTLVERFNTALTRTEQRRRERLLQREAQARLQAVLDTLLALTTGDAGFDAAALERIGDEWREAGGDNQQPSIAALQARFNHTMQQARRQHAEQGREREQLAGSVGELLAQLESALDEGQLQQAVSAQDKVRARLERLRAQGGSASAAQQKRLQKAVARLQELRDWRRFGTNRAREALLEQAHDLAHSKLAPMKLAEEVKTLRNAWRRLDRKDGPASEALWQAFDQAAESAYAPCAAYYEAQQQERRDHLEARERFLAELEQYYDEIDWPAPDWSALEQRLQQARKRWQKLGGVEHREWQEVNGRFRQLLERFEQHLGPLREREKVRREGLISVVEKLADEADLDKALAETRAAQAAWRPELSVQPRIEQGLWRRFKSACDAVYARQRAQSQAQREAEQGEQARLQQLCAEIESLAASLDTGNWKQGRARLAELRQQWRDVAPRISRRSKALATRFDDALAAFARAEAALEQQRAEAERGLLLQKAGLCEALEARLFERSGAEVESLAASWQALPALRDNLLEHALEVRFTRTLAALREGGDTLGRFTASAPDNLVRCQTLCLQLELLASIDSPAAFAEARLTMQVAMLSDAMTGQLSEAERRGKAGQLLCECLAIGPLPPQERDELSVRLRAVLASGVLS